MDDVRPLKTYSIYNRKSTFCHLGWALGAHIFYTRFRTLFFGGFLQLLRFWCQKGAQMGRQFCGKMDPFSTASPKVAQLGSKGGQGLQKDTKMEPQVTKMDPK